MLVGKLRHLAGDRAARTYNRSMRALLFAAALAGCASLDRPPPADPALEVGALPRRGAASAAPVIATFNVHGESPAEIAAAIAADPLLARADVLMLQEIEHRGSDSAARRLAAELGMAHAYAPGYGIGEAGSHGVAILARGRLDDVAVIELPRYRVMFNSARRIALAATVELGGRASRLYNVHLDNRINPRDRLDQLAPVLADADRHVDLPALIAGDFNTSPFCWLGHVVPLPCGLQTRAVERAMHRRGFAAPTAGSGATSRYLGMRLDAVFVRDLSVSRVAVADVWLSDHFPLVVALCFRSGTRLRRGSTVDSRLSTVDKRPGVHKPNCRLLTVPRSGTFGTKTS
jgi:endonuclease/exonuclease/phosphatase family metal-dependent hydrolase